jgi:hypothetical protein
VRAEGERIEADEYQLLFAPSMSIEAFEEQLQAIHHRDIPLVWRLKTEGEYLLAAAYGILSMAMGIRRVSSGDVNPCVQKALAAFEKSAPDTDLLRHVHVHVDAYIRGEGTHTDRLPDPAEMGGIAMLDTGPVYWIGGKLFVLSEIKDDAETLADAVGRCVEPH